MQKKEAEITTRLRKHLQEAGLHLGSCAIEVKVSKTKSLPFNAVKPHQLQALKNARGTFVWKIADDSIGIKPFDMFMLQNAGAYVAVSWLVPRAPAIVYLIPVDVWCRLAESSKRKSLTEDSLLESGVRNLKIVLPSTNQVLAPS